MDLSRVDWEQQPWRLVRPGVERKSFSGQGATLALHRLMPGHEPRPHSHPHEQIAYILAGTLRFHIGGEQHLVGPGGVIAIPNGWVPSGSSGSALPVSRSIGVTDSLPALTT